MRNNIKGCFPSRFPHFLDTNKGQLAALLGATLRDWLTVWWPVNTRFQVESEESKEGDWQTFIIDSRKSDVCTYMSLCFGM